MTLNEGGEYPVTATTVLVCLIGFGIGYAIVTIAKAASKYNKQD